MKKWAMILCLIFSVMSVSAVMAAEQAEEAHGTVIDSGYAFGGTWTFYEDGTLSITGTDYVSYNNRADVPWYPYMDQILYAELGEELEWMGNYLFCDAVNLQTVSFPEALEVIDMRVFSGCESLESVEFPDSLERIDYWAFSSCNSLTEVHLGQSMTEISNYAFQNCRGLLRVVVDAPVTRLGYDVFENCTSLEELYLPSSLTLIDLYALNNCPALTDIYYAGTQEEWERVQIEDQRSFSIEDIQIHFNSPFEQDTHLSDGESANDHTGSNDLPDAQPEPDYAERINEAIGALVETRDDLPDAQPEPDYAEMVNDAIGVLAEEWNELYWDEEFPEREYLLDIRSTRVICIRDDLPDKAKEIFGNIKYLVEFLLYDEYSSCRVIDGGANAGYYLYSVQFDTVNVDRDGSMECGAGNKIRIYRSKTYDMDLGPIVEKIVDFHEQYNQVIRFKNHQIIMEK